MYFTKNKVPTILMALLLLIVCLPVMSMAESAEVQEIMVTNTPVKGRIQVQKQGPVLTGFNEHQDPFGYTVHTPVYGKGYLEGAVFEVRAVEDIVGKDGTLWFKADEIAAQITTTAEGSGETAPLPLGHYYVTEVSAPAGYLFDGTRYDVVLEAKDHVTPMVNACVIAVNDYLPTRISMIKEKEILKTETDKDGMTHTTLTRVPGEGFIFGLYNSDPIAYKDGLLDADVLLSTAISDKNGQISFSGHFPHGNYYVRELAGPEGWKLNETDYPLQISDDHRTENKEIVINLDAPVVNELVHSDVRVSKTDLTGSDYLPHTLIEVKSEDGKTVLKDYTGDDGYLPSFPAVPGKYTYGEWIIRENAAPEGYSKMEDIRFQVHDGWKEPKPILCVNIPNHYEFKKTDSSGNPLAGVKFRLEDENGKDLGTYESGKDGMVQIKDLKPGTYLIREIETLEGYSVSGEVIKL